jgi:hypothetical protein
MHQILLSHSMPPTKCRYFYHLLGGHAKNKLGHEESEDMNAIFMGE